MVYSEWQCVVRMSYTELYRKLLHFNRVLQMVLAFSK